jgi:hypothetical protein
MEELLLLKAGDKPKFSRSDKTMDRIVAAALLLELVHERKLAIDGEFTTDPRKLVLRLVDDSHTGSNVVNSAVAAIKKHNRGPLLVSTVIEKISKSGGGITQKMLWRLVQKGKCVFDPHAFGQDKYPVVGGAQDLAVLRERVVQAMDMGAEAPVLRNQMLAFLYYLPRNASDKVFPQMSSSEEVYLICKAVGNAMVEYKQQRNSFI